LNFKKNYKFRKLTKQKIKAREKPPTLFKKCNTFERWEKSNTHSFFVLDQKTTLNWLIGQFVVGRGRLQKSLINKTLMMFFAPCENTMTFFVRIYNCLQIGVDFG
jgi:hypothetical protein